MESTVSGVAGVVGSGVGVGVGTGVGVGAGVGEEAGVGDGVGVGAGVGVGVCCGISATVPTGPIVSAGSASDPQPAIIARIRMHAAIKEKILRYIVVYLQFK
jgi:hypothetical protein